MKTKHLVIVLFLFISGCSLNLQKQLDNIEDTGDKLDTLRDEHEPTPVSEQEPEHVEFPRDEAWLNRPLVLAGLRRMPLRMAMTEILPTNPISYLIDKHYDPDITSNPEAKTIRDHLEAISLQANLGWHYQSGTIIFTNTVTRQYPIALYGGGTNVMKVNANNLSSNVSDNQITNSITVTIHLLAELKKFITSTINIKECIASTDTTTTELTTDQTPSDPVMAMHGFPGLEPQLQVKECFDVSGSANLITLTARPQTLLRFESAYQQFIESLNRNVNLKILTIKIDVTDLSQQRLDLDILRSGTDISGSLTNIVSDITSSQSTAAGGNLGAVLDLTLERAGSPWIGSQIVLQNLESIANLSIEDSREIIAYSNRLITIQDTDTLTYIREIRRDPETVGNTTTFRTSVTSDQILTGQALNIMPSLTDTHIALHIVINESTLIRLKVDGTEDTRITLPDTSNSDVVFDVTLRDKEIALIASSTRSETQTREDKSGLLPIKFIDRLFSNSNEGQQRVYQTLYLIEASFRQQS